MLETRIRDAKGAAKAITRAAVPYTAVRILVFALMAWMTGLLQVGCSHDRATAAQVGETWFWGQCLNHVEQDDELGHQFKDLAAFVHATGIRWSANGSVGLAFSSDTEADAKMLLELIRQEMRKSPQRWTRLAFFEKPTQD